MKKVYNLKARISHALYIKSTHCLSARVSFFYINFKVLLVEISNFSRILNVTNDIAIAAVPDESSVLYNLIWVYTACVCFIYTTLSNFSRK